MGALYQHWIGFSRKIAGYSVHPHGMWYWTWYPPVGIPCPGTVHYVYTDEHGREVGHGQTYWGGTKLREPARPWEAD